MASAHAGHLCSCGTRLAADNRTGRCAACRKKDRDRLLRPPTVPANFWDHRELRAALASRHFGRVLRAYRCHPHHGLRPLAQDVTARWFGITQPQLSRIENGPPTVHLDRLGAWAQLLGIPEHLLCVRLPADDALACRRPLSPKATLPAAAPASTLPQLTRELVPSGVNDLAALQSLRTADSQIGGGYLYAAVTGYLQHTVAPRMFGTTSLTDESGVFTAAAGLTEMAGWMAHDAGRDALAEQHFQRALGMATVARTTSSAATSWPA
jgi:transcriptional regulator with XRE-family HTH domain